MTALRWCLRLPRLRSGHASLSRYCGLVIPRCPPRGRRRSDSWHRRVVPGGHVAASEPTHRGGPARAGQPTPSLGAGLVLFQQTRSRSSTQSVEWVAARSLVTNSGPVVSVASPALASAQGGEAPGVGSSAALDPLALSGGRREDDRINSIPRHPTSGAPPPTVSEGERASATEWFGTTALESIPLPLSRLQYPWRLHVRKGVCVEEILNRTWLRPDLARVCKIHSAGAGPGARLALERLMAEGDGFGYQLLDDLPGDRTFAFSVAEVEFVDRMGAFLFGPGQESPPRFVLSEVAGRYVLPRPYPYSKPRV